MSLPSRPRAQARRRASRPVLSELESRRLLDGGARFAAGFGLVDVPPVFTDPGTTVYTNPPSLDPRRIATDAAGNVYVSGRFHYTIQFGAGADSPRVVNTGHELAYDGRVLREGPSNGFVAKYSPDGVAIWARSFGPGDVNLSGLAVDPQGNVFLAGTVADPMDGFGGGIVDLDPGPGVATVDQGSAFLLKLDAAGNFGWLNSFAGYGLTSGTADDPTAEALAYDPRGFVTIVGGFSDPDADFQPGPGVTNLGPTGQYSDSYVVRYAADDGRLIWARALHGVRSLATQVATDPTTGDLVIGGRFTGFLDLDPGPGETLADTRPPLTDPGWYNLDTYLVRLDTSGHFVWGFGLPRMLGPNGQVPSGLNRVDDLVVAPDGGIYVAGYASSPTDVDPGPDIVMMGDPGDDPQVTYLARYGADGTLAWARSNDGTTMRLAVGPAGEVYLSTRGSDGASIFKDRADDFRPSTAYVDASGTLVDARAGVVARIDGNGHMTGLRPILGRFRPADQVRPGGEAENGDLEILGIAVRPDGSIATLGNLNWAVVAGSSRVDRIGYDGADRYLRAGFLAALDPIRPTPAAPPSPTLDPASDLGFRSDDGITSAQRLVFHVTGVAADARVELLQGDPGNTQPGYRRAWRIGPGELVIPQFAAYPEVGYDVQVEFRVRTVDPEGVVSRYSAPLAARLENVAPRLNPPFYPGFGDVAYIRGTPTLTVFGTAELGARVELIDEHGNVLATSEVVPTIPFGNGYSLIIPPTFTGKHILRVRAWDAAGNVNLSEPQPFEIVVLPDDNGGGGGGGGGGNPPTTPVDPPVVVIPPIFVNPPVVTPPIEFPPVPVPSGPRLLKAAYGKDKKTGARVIILTFDSALDAKFTNRAWYTLGGAGKDKRFGNRDDNRPKVRKVAYNAKAKTITLTPDAKLVANQPLRLTIARALTGALSDPIANLGPKPR